MAVTKNALPVPEADRQGALVVSITQDGSVYIGIRSTSPEVLAESLKRALSNQKDKRIYIKGDARSSYARVEEVLGAVSAVGVEAPVLLTAQQDSPEVSMPVPPKGLEVWVGPSRPTVAQASVVEMLGSGQRPPTLKVNNEQIDWAALPHTLTQLLQGQGERMVQIRTAGTLAFADVVAAIDISRSVGAKVFLVTPGPAGTKADSPVAGTWRGKTYDLPAVVLTVKDDHGELSGTVLFYLLHRKTEQDPWEVDTTHSKPLPLLDPKFDGKTLSFQVSHKEAHPPRTLNDPPVSFEMRLTGKGEAELQNLSERHAAGLKMVRDAK